MNDYEFSMSPEGEKILLEQFSIVWDKGFKKGFILGIIMCIGIVIVFHFFR